MRVWTLRLLCVALIMCCQYIAFAHVALNTPLGGESFFASTIETISWDDVIPHDTENWDLYISYNGGDSWAPLFLNIPPDQFSFAWNVPYIASDQVRIRVVQDNNIDIDYEDESGDFTIIVPPQDGPVIEHPATDLTLSCDEPNLESIIEEWLQENGGALASGVCGDLHWTNNYNGVSDGCGMTGTALVTFSVSDDCGGNLTSANITIVDEMPPEIIQSAESLVLECAGGDPQMEAMQWLETRGGALSTDDCSDVSWLYTITDYTETCNSGFSMEVEFAASDACGNSSTTTASFIAQDTEAPEITALPGDLLLECDGTDQIPLIDHWVNEHGFAHAVDACGVVTWTFELQDAGHPCELLSAYQVYFIASDACGNSSSANAFADITDTSPPVWIHEPHDTVIYCSGDPSTALGVWLNHNAGALAFDECSEVNFANNFSGNASCTDHIGRVTFWAMDECLNSDTASATYTILPITSVDVVSTEKMRILPNPARDEMIVETNDQPANEAQVVIYNILGDVVKHFTQTSSRMNYALDDVTPGVYYVLVSSAAFTEATTLIVE